MKIGIIQQARQAVADQNHDERAKLLKTITSKKYRFASPATVRKVKALLA